MVVINLGREVQQKATKQLLDVIILQLLSNKTLCGYEIITSIKKTYSISLGASTIYSMLAMLEKKGLVSSEWLMSHNSRPRKIYHLTSKGRDTLYFMGCSLRLICKSIE